MAMLRLTTFIILHFMSFLLLLFCFLQEGVCPAALWEGSAVFLSEMRLQRGKLNQEDGSRKLRVLDTLQRHLPFLQGSRLPVPLHLCISLLSSSSEEPRISKVGNHCFVFLFKYSQQIKCACVGLELATVQLICRILCHSPVLLSAQLASIYHGLASPQNTSFTHAHTHGHTPFYPVVS